MAYTYEEAKMLVYDKCLRKNGDNTEAVVFDDLTSETTFGWSFYYNNATFHRTREVRDAWAGPGPVLFNKETGEIRVFGSGGNELELIEDYEFELKARKSNSEWGIELDSHDAKLTALKLRRIFELDGKEALALAKKWSPYFFIGKKRDLESIRETLVQNDLNARTVLFEKDRAHQNCVVWKSADSLHDGYIRSLRTLQPSEAYARKDLDRNEVFIEGVLTIVNGTPVVISRGSADRYISLRQKEMIAKIQEIGNGLVKDLSQFMIAFKGTIWLREDQIEVGEISSFQLRHSVHGYGVYAFVSRSKGR
ncbi:MAG TPA: YrhB domain-containing protein [Oligoflexus sp.]|uniref:YrhB domain-containing protein n=1 Tax=Oligoflexus sp. TaxID=1971216 RepID=UPI002D6286A0|nr:YrhB domain-containing protein [Oligoflexus sp.]HYX37770.1 YrhB domain-containing protein [Oligoflexus sp.]